MSFITKSIIEVKGDSAENIKACAKSLLIDEKMDFNKFIPTPTPLRINKMPKEALIAYLSNKFTDTYKMVKERVIRKYDLFLSPFTKEEYEAMKANTNEGEKHINVSLDGTKTTSLASTDIDELRLQSISYYDAGEIYAKNLAQFGLSNGFDWQRINWGTTNVQSTKVIIDEKCTPKIMTIIIVTPDRVPMPIFEHFLRFCEIHRVSMDIAFASNDYGVGTGRVYLYENGDFVPEFYRNGSEDALTVAKKVLGDF